MYAYMYVHMHACSTYAYKHASMQICACVKYTGIYLVSCFMFLNQFFSNLDHACIIKYHTLIYVRIIKKIKYAYYYIGRWNLEL